MLISGSCTRLCLLLLQSMRAPPPIRHFIKRKQDEDETHSRGIRLLNVLGGLSCRRQKQINANNNHQGLMPKHKSFFYTRSHAKKSSP
ncbi:hypothetical protein BJX96DRAFT_79107 [Aspergillus floccosus]